MKHTKGPWVIKKDVGYNRYCIDDLEGTQAQPIVELGFRDAEHLNSEANLRLIAAAPELLQSLKETLSCIDSWTHDPVVGPIIEFAKQVIAKAEGDIK